MGRGGGEEVCRAFLFPASFTGQHLPAVNQEHADYMGAVHHSHGRYCSHTGIPAERRVFKGKEFFPYRVLSAQYHLNRGHCHCVCQYIRQQIWNTQLPDQPSGV